MAVFGEGLLLSLPTPVSIWGHRLFERKTKRLRLYRVSSTLPALVRI